MIDGDTGRVEPATAPCVAVFGVKYRFESCHQFVDGDQFWQLRVRRSFQRGPDFIRAQFIGLSDFLDDAVTGH